MNYMTNNQKKQSAYLTLGNYLNSFQNEKQNDVVQLLHEFLSDYKLAKDKNTELLTREETAEYLKCSKGTIRNWTDKGWLIAYGIGTKIYYKKNEIINSLKQVYENN